jgi:hypothetical protein
MYPSKTHMEGGKEAPIDYCTKKSVIFPIILPIFCDAKS